MELQRLLLYFIIFITLFMTFFFLMVFLESRNKKSRKLKLENSPKVTFVIPAYNAAPFLKETVDSIFDSDYPKGKINVLIVNDGSKDNTLEVAKSICKKYPTVSVLSKKNEGKAVALNYGIKYVKTPVTIVLDADTLPKRDLIRKAIIELQNSSTMAVTCKMIPQNRKGFLARMQVIEYAFTSFYRKLTRHKNALQTTPAFTVFKTEVFRRFGYFDPHNLTEDMEMGMRIQSHHYDIGYVLDSYAITAVPYTFNSLARQRIRWSYGTLYNLYKYKKMFSSEYGDLGVFFLPSIIVGVIIMLCVSGLLIYNFADFTINFIHKIALGWQPSFLDINMFSLIISLTDLRIILTVFSFLIAIGIFFLIRHETKEKLYLIDWILYLFIYIWMLAYFYIAALFFLIVKKPEW